MKRSILKINGLQQLNKNQQSKINGGQACICGGVSGFVGAVVDWVCGCDDDEGN